MKKCHDCNGDLVDGAAFCPACGRAVIDLPGEEAVIVPKTAPRDPMATQVGMPVPLNISSTVTPTRSDDPVNAESTQTAAVDTLMIEPSHSERATIIQMPGLRDDGASEPDGESAHSPILEASPPPPVDRNDSGWSVGRDHGDSRAESGWSLENATPVGMEQSQSSDHMDSGPSHRLASAGREVPGSISTALDAADQSPQRSEPSVLQTPPVQPTTPSASSDRLQRLLMMLGALLIAAGVGAGGRVLMEGAGQPLSIGTAQATINNGLMHVRIPMRAKRPVYIRYPGGRVQFEGDKTIRFNLPAAKPKFEPIRLDVTAREGDTPIPLEVSVEPVYRLRTISATNTRLEIQLTHRFGWKASVKPGRLHRIDSTSFRWVIDLTDAALKGRSKLTAEDSLVDLKGGIRNFSEVLNVPSMVTPLSIRTPVAHLTTKRTSVQVSGSTLPGAQVMIEGASILADAVGYFEVQVPLPIQGHQTISLTCTAAGREPVTQHLSVVRRSSKLYRREVERLRAMLAARSQTLSKKPSYDDLGAAPSDEWFPFAGRLVSIERVDAGTSLAVVSLCDSGSKCPALIHVSGPCLAEAGQRIRGVGRSLGLRRYRSQDNHTRNVPRIEAEYIVQ